MRKLIFLAGLLFVTNAEAADGWSSLWRTPDQRGEQLLQQGDAAAAARTYTDPRRKAYAELQAGDYAAATNDFGAFDDSDAHYDQGNALVRSGDLQQALKAYDTALVRNPDNLDARHNRDLVAQALKQQQQKSQSQQSQQQQSQQQKQQDQQQKNSTASGQPQSGKDANQNADSKGQEGKSADAKSQQQADARKSNSGDAGKQGDQNQNQAAKPSQSNQAGQSAPQDASKTGDEAAQAQRDAANGLKQAAQDKTNKATGQANDAGQVPQEDSRAVPTPSTEQQLAQEQWLRRIPDDPGGLLRRKFMIEHMMRQQNPQP